MTNDYCTTTDVQNGFVDDSLRTTTDTGFTTLIPILITRASRLIDNEVGRWPGYFYPTTDDATRYYNGSGGVVQQIDDCFSLTTVSVAEDGGIASTSYTDWTENTDYIVEPYNYSANGEPFDKLVILYNGGKSYWYRWQKSVKVVGLFGWSASPPDEIKQATVIQTVRWYMRSKQGYQDAAANPLTGQIYMTKLDPDVKQLLWRYKVRNQV